MGWVPAEQCNAIEKSLREKALIFVALHAHVSKALRKLLALRVKEQG